MPRHKCVLGQCQKCISHCEKLRIPYRNSFGFFILVDLHKFVQIIPVTYACWYSPQSACIMVDEGLSHEHAPCQKLCKACVHSESNWLNLKLYSIAHRVWCYGVNTKEKMFLYTFTFFEVMVVRPQPRTGYPLCLMYLFPLLHQVYFCFTFMLI